jgi:hypothetical protein
MRKKIVLVVVTLFFIKTINAQIKKGEQMAGGTFSFQFSRSETDAAFPSTAEGTSFSVTPQFGIGLKKNWIVGAGIGYYYSKGRNESGSNFQEQVSDFINFSVFVRKFHPFGDRIGIFGQADAGLGFGKQKGKSNQFSDFENKLTSYSIMARPGFYFKPAKRLVIEAMFGNLGFTHSIYKPDSGSKTISDQFEFTLTNSLSLGFMLIL